MQLLLLYRYMASAAEVILLQNKSQKDHDGRSHGKDHEGVNISRGARLGLNGSIDSGVGRHLRRMFVQPCIGQSLGKADDRSLQARIPGANVADKDLLMKLSASREQRRHQRSSDTAPNIAHEIDDSGDCIVLLRGYPNI